ncbi:MAG: hypothetical protein ACWGOV_10790 [Acidiferrobacterales bacterium]
MPARLWLPEHDHKNLGGLQALAETQARAAADQAAGEPGGC